MSSIATKAPKIGHIPSLNGLRAIAIGIVVWAHAHFPGHLAGGLGVSLFFFLSGYLITTLLRAEYDRYEKISFSDFYKRRALRIFPPMYIVIAMVILLSLVGFLPNTMTAGGAASTALFLTNYWIITHGHEGVPAGLGIFWSLAVEEHFYLVFPLMYVAMRKWLPKRAHQVSLLLGLCFIVLAWRIFLWMNGASGPRLYYATDTRMDALLWGAILAIGFNPVYGEARLPSRPWAGTAIVIASAAAFYASSKIPGQFVIGFTIQSIAAFGIFVPLILAPKSRLGRLLNWKPIAWIGVISYSLYLFHRWLLEAAEFWAPDLGALGAVCAIVCAVLLSWAMRAWVEKPLARRRKQLSRVGESSVTPQLSGVTSESPAKPAEEPAAG
ncbi:Peptidoglycan/LPS O-acetylase OafA/YrhL, contains acyltransferase and SGNH-hydrolase domains [Quadrisphaera granulorum]|uniref:Peptidoglycan/LPS O-acetylase OafA/YrhL n=1 Tax=Quadrisphaera granulorum TaxID=317664 RepID=A0A316ABK9_9ACTN|nr:acyltransferase [Quadrisphaera granulorum]PWJ55105.1 peptidoglycan/LPS O-acetylase OafA/YrhL [Quadrisphaera granulorum]SZE95614.1 Peptidoglycan/LPS O-acetylase OafA/YrhL, contains acyltransferase and SGNH-hydrolase domains [Quadrisphaera granulorum]